MQSIKLQAYGEGKNDMIRLETSINNPVGCATKWIFLDP